MKRIQRNAVRSSHRRKGLRKVLVTVTSLVAIGLLFGVRISMPMLGSAQDGADPPDTLARLIHFLYLPFVSRDVAGVDVAGECVDGDGDGYVDCGTCDPAAGQICGDCDDSNFAVHPGAAEPCDGVDNDCDGDVDEGFVVGRESLASTAYDCGDQVDNDGDGLVDDEDPECVAAAYYFEYPPGCSPAIGTSCCSTRSFYQCTPDGTGTFPPEPETGLNEPVGEVPYTPTCHDEEDNDCDQLIDGDDPDCPSSPEICNGLDDDYDGQVDDGFTYGGANVGDPCTVGTGGCERTGTVICGDEATAVCSVAPALPVGENTPGEGRCLDSIDNDCDGLTDLDDPGCQEPEKCDGYDNDGDGQIDEDFGDLGAPCTVGEGACQASGVKICSADGAETVCSGVPSLPSTEGPTGATCSDGIDNDCDGLTDEFDPGCGSVDLAAWCALPYLRGEPGNDCTGWHEVGIVFGVNAGPDALVTAELMTLDLDGNVIESAPVSYGDAAHLASRVDPEDYKFSSKTNVQGTRHEAFAPVPLLHVAVQDGLNEAHAYCSNIPYLKVMEPSGTVVSESEGDVTPVLVAIPLVDPSSLMVKVDGVDILAGLGITDPSVCAPSTPCGGTVEINSQMVEVSELVVQGMPVDTLGSNTLSMNLANLGCGGHIVVVEGTKLPGSFPDSPADACYVDDLRDKGTSSGLAVEVYDPTEGQVVSSAPVLVAGKACSGRELAGVEINGKVLDVSGQTLIPGDGEDSADTYELEFDTTLDETNLVQDVTLGDTRLGTFDVGSNRLIAMATDDLGNRAFETLIFAVGDVASPGGGMIPTAVLESTLEETLEQMLSQDMRMTLDATSIEIENAFVVGLTPEAVQTLFTEKCSAAEAEFKNKVTSAILAREPVYKRVSGGCSCDPKVKIWITGVSFDGSLSCPVTFQEDQFHVRVNLPDVIVSAAAYGRCKTTGLFGECWAETIVEGTATTTISEIRMDFDVTEDQLKGATGPEPTFEIGAEADVDANISSDVNCVAAACNWLIEGLVTIFTFGTVDLDLTPSIDISKDLDFNVEIGASQPDPVSLGEIKVDEEEVEEYEQALEGTLDTVHITAEGIVAGLKGIFTTLTIDPEVEETPGAVLTPAGLPVLPVDGAEDVFVVLADDTFNQFLASLVVSGKLKTGCQDSGKTIGDLLPASCDDIVVGTCSNDSSLSCGSDGDCSGGTCTEAPLKTALARGACHAFKGDDCDALPLLQKGACNETQSKLNDINISASTPLLFCARQDIPPRLLIVDDAGTSEIETVLRLNDLSVAMIVDRDENGFDGELASTPKCLAEGAPTGGDCSFFAVCLDLNLETAMQLATKHCQNDPAVVCTGDTDCAAVGGSCVEVCEEGEPGLVTRVNGVQLTVRAAGVPCGGAPTPGDDDLVANTAGENQTIDVLLENANRFTPPACVQGLTLGGFVEFENPKLIAIEVDGDLSFQDYFGLTGGISP